MKSFFPLFSASLAVLALAACSPSTPESDAPAAVSEIAVATMAADAAETVVTESEAGSAATVVVTVTETYDPAVIRRIGEKPGYWELKRTDPKTHKLYTTHVCVDKPLAARLAKQGDITAPAGRGDYRTDARFEGECPGGVKGGDVQRSDGNRVNAYGGRHPDQTPAGKRTDDPSHNPHVTPAEDHANDRSNAGQRPERTP